MITAGMATPQSAEKTGIKPNGALYAEVCTLACVEGVCEETCYICNNGAHATTKKIVANDDGHYNYDSDPNGYTSVSCGGGELSAAGFSPRAARQKRQTKQLVTCGLSQLKSCTKKCGSYNNIRFCTNKQKHIGGDELALAKLNVSLRGETQKRGEIS